MDAAIAARDVEALLSLTEASESVHHPTGTVYPERRSVPALRSVFEVYKPGAGA